MCKQEHQIELERLYDKNQLMPRIREAIRECEPVMEIVHKAELLVTFCVDLIAVMAVHKRATVPTLIGCLRHHFENSHLTALALEQAVTADLVDYSSREQEFIVRYQISQELKSELDRFQYPLPMVVPPREVQTNLDSGYLMGRGSVILRDNHHEDDVVLDHLNRINSTKFCINLDTALTIQNKWKGLDKKHPDERWEDFQKRKKAFAKYDSVAKDVMNVLLQEGNELYLTHKYDKRGRTYCMGFHVNYQGTDWNKSCIEFADKELLTD